MFMYRNLYMVSNLIIIPILIRKIPIRYYSKIVQPAFELLLLFPNSLDFLLFMHSWTGLTQNFSKAD